MDFKTPVKAELDLDIYSLSAGYFVFDNLLLSTGYLHQEIDYDLSWIKTIKVNDYFISAKYVKEMEGTAYNLEGRILISTEDNDNTDKNDTNTVVEIEGDYYFNQKISLGGSLAFNNGDDEWQEGKTISVRNKTYFTHNFAVAVEFEQFYVDDEEKGEDDKTISITLSTYL